MINDIKTSLESKFKDLIKSLKVISYDDDNKEYLVELIEDGFDYDNVIKKIASDSKKSPSSPDCLYINKSINFIEFKNGKIDGKEQLKIKLKVVEGIYNFKKFVADEKIDESFSNLQNIRTRFILVYNKKKNESNVMNMRRSLNKSAKIPMFGLDRFDFYYDEVITMDEEEFQNKFIDYIKLETKKFA